MSSWVTEASQPPAGVVSAVSRGCAQPAQSIDVRLVSPEPPSRKLTWMSASGTLTNVATAVPVGSLSVQFVPATTVTVVGRRGVPG